jgi:alkylhydroperoxidase family enzyme
MGHCEMLLAVAGLDSEAVTERTRRLAGDWSSFPPGEQAAFAFARKQARKPWTVGDDDVEELVRHFGRERALDVIWWACRCHYMTRVADAFQLPLEQENVFAAPAPAKETPKKP